MAERELLIAHGFDGLYHPDPDMSCGCYADDLYPCGERPRACRPGHAAADGSGIFGPALRRGDGDRKPSEAGQPGKSKTKKARCRKDR